MTGRFPSPIVAYFVSLAVIGLSTFPAPAAVPPAQGPVVPALAAFDKVMQEFMDENDISAGQLAIMRNGVVVFERSYGWQDKERMKPLPLGAPMRVGSVSKPITAAAIRALIRQKKLTLKTRVFSLRKGDGGMLNFKPYPKRARPDRYLKDITIGHLLRHRGGWDKETVGDLTYRELRIARAMKIASPPGPINTVRYIMGKSLQHRPGSQYAYSNIGYLVLGLVIKKVLADEKGVKIEEVSDDDYLKFLRTSVVLPTGIKDSDLILGRSLQVHADAREPHYDRPEMRPSVFDLDPSTTELVEAPYGSFDMEARTGQGRIVTNARSIVLFLDKFMVGPRDGAIGAPRWPPGSWKYSHTGKLRGTSALARARGDSINYAVIFNKDSSDEDDDGNRGYAAQIRKQLDELIDSAVIKWP